MMEGILLWNDDPECNRVKLNALRMVEEHGGLGIWSLDLQADELKWTSSLYRMLGLIPFQQKASFDLYRSITHPEDRLDTADWLSLAGTSQGHRHRIIRPDGQIRWLRAHGSVVYAADAVPARMVGVVYDITEPTRWHEAHQREVGLISALRELTSGVVWTTDADGSVVDPVDWRAAVGHHGNNHMGWRRLDEVHPEDQQVVRDAWAKAMRNRRHYAAQYRAEWDGEYRLVSSRGSAVRDAAGEVLAWVGFSQAHALGAREPGANTTTVASALYPSQIRAARAILGWTARDLSDKTGLSFSTIRRAEVDDRKSISHLTLETVRSCFETAGVSFGIGGEGSISVTLKAPTK